MSYLLLLNDQTFKSNLLEAEEKNVLPSFCAMQSACGHPSMRRFRSCPEGNVRGRKRSGTEYCSLIYGRKSLVSYFIPEYTDLQRELGSTGYYIHRSGQVEKSYLGYFFPSPRSLFFHSLKFLWQTKSKKQKNISFKLFYLRIKPREHWISAWNGNVLFVLIKMQGGCRHSGIRDKETLVSGTAFIFMAFKWPEAALRSLEKPGSC